MDRLIELRKMYNDTWKQLGTFQAISALEAKELDSWTLDETEGVYYAAI
jgi:hypothetical protein